jgi:hypothetical protein
MQSPNAPNECFASSVEMIDAIRREFPLFRIVDKQSDWFSKCIDVALRVVTLGGQRRYLSHYHTVIGNTLYVPQSWHSSSEVNRVVTLRHERIHLRQRQRMGFGLMAFVYLIPFFPLGLAYGRARLEWEAYAETLRAIAELEGVPAANSPQLRGEIVRRFTGPDYGWMWPFPRAVERWYDAVLLELEHSLPREERHSVQIPN